MATAFLLIRDCATLSEERATWRSDGWLEDNRCFVGCDGLFATHAWMLPSIAVLGRSGVGRSFCVLERRSSLVSRTLGCLARGGLLPGLPRGEVPSAAEQDCTRRLGRGGGAGCLSAVLSPSAGGLAGRHIQSAKSSNRAVVLFLSHVRELRPTACGIQ